MTIRDRVDMTAATGVTIVNKRVIDRYIDWDIIRKCEELLENRAITSEDVIKTLMLARYIRNHIKDSPAVSSN